ncbi:hypothetical protein ABR738_14445 [Streptomyces sp. Edi4]|uniref:hypothetical protein n=1 Tax=Streptomyces sp. Edi4 TaxID=3162527 RepID=UPI003305D1CA
MPAIIETTETDKPEVAESDTEIATEDGQTGVGGDDQGDSDTAEPLGAYAVLMA